MEWFSVSGLKDDELEFVVTHVADCETCEKHFVYEVRRRRPEPARFSLETEFWFRHDHLEFKDLVGFADETLDSELKEIFGIHLSSCKRCREELSSSLLFRKPDCSRLTGWETVLESDALAKTETLSHPKS